MIENWTKSSYSYSNGACVEVATHFRKSSYSPFGNNCVEAGDGAGVIAIRDTQDRGGFTLVVSSGAWSAFTRGLK